MAIKTPYRIIGVDPGTNFLGFAIVEIQGKEIILQQMGVVRMNRLSEHQEKLKKIFVDLQDLIHTFKPNQMALEAPFYGKNIQSMLKLGRAQGVAMAAGLSMGLSIQEYSPRKIKQAVTGNGNAAKEQVAAMVSHIIKRPLPPSELDATDALATAICHYYQSTNAISGSKRYNSWEAFLKANPDRKG